MNAQSIRRGRLRFAWPFVLLLAMILSMTGNALAHFDPPTAHLAVFLSLNEIGGYTWPKDDGSQVWVEGDDPVLVDLDVYAAPGGVLLHHDEQFTSLRPSEHEGYEMESFVHFDLGGFTIQRGDYVVLSSAAATKTHTVSNLDVTEFNTDADILRGTADPGQTVEVSLGCEFPHCPTVYPTAVGGVWEADFTGVADVKPGDGGMVVYREPGDPANPGNPDYDADAGDLTLLEWGAPYPTIMA